MFSIEPRGHRMTLDDL